MQQLSRRYLDSLWISSETLITMESLGMERGALSLGYRGGEVAPSPFDASLGGLLGSAKVLVCKSAPIILSMALSLSAFPLCFADEYLGTGGSTS